MKRHKLVGAGKGGAQRAAQVSYTEHELRKALLHEKDESKKELIRQDLNELLAEQRQAARARLGL